MKKHWNYICTFRFVSENVNIAIFYPDLPMKRNRRTYLDALLRELAAWDHRRKTMR